MNININEWVDQWVGGLADGWVDGWVESLSPLTFLPSLICYAKPLPHGTQYLNGVNLGDATSDLMYLTWVVNKKGEPKPSICITGDGRSVQEHP